MDTQDEKVYIVPTFDGGMQRRTTMFLRAQNELLLAKNTDLQYMLGGIAKCLGYTQKGNEIASSRTLLGAGALNNASGTNKLIAFVNKASSGADAYVYNSSTEVWDAASRSYTADQSFETASFLNMLFEVNGLTDAPETYTGSAWSTSANVTDMPKAKFIVLYDERLYVFNITLAVGGNFPSRAWYCDLPKNNAIVWDFESGTDLATTASSAVITSAGSLFKTRGIKVGDPVFITTDADAGQYEVLSVDSETQLTLTQTLTATDTGVSFWVGGNWFDVMRDNSDVGMGIALNSGRLLLFKRFSLHRFTKTADATTDSLEQVKGVPGTVSHRSIASVREYTFYAADSGIWRYNGVTSEMVSNAIKEVWDGVSASNYSSITSWVIDDRILKIYVGDVSNTDTGLTISKCVLCHDAFGGTWWVESIEDTIKASVDWVDSSARKTYIFGNGECFQDNIGTSFDGVAIDEEVETPFYFPIAPEVSFGITRFKVYTERGRALDCQYKLAYYDSGNGIIIDEDWKELGVSNKTEYEANYKLKDSEGKASGFALKFRDASTTTRPVITRIAAYRTDPEQR